MIFPIDVITRFIDDEGLGPYKVFHDSGDEWAVNINEPWNDDSKMRCGIACRFHRPTGKTMVMFNAYKSVAELGDEYKGTFEKFLCLIKGFDSRRAARLWFAKTYLYEHMREILEGTAARPNTRGWDDDDAEQAECALPDDFEPLSWKSPGHSPYARYLESRGITRERLAGIPVYVDSSDGRVVFPVVDRGRITFWTGRSIAAGRLPWKNVKVSDALPIWGLDRAGLEPLVFEAVFDALSVPNGIAILGATNSASDEVADKLARSGCTGFGIVMDNDAAGVSAKKRLADKLAARGKRVSVYDFGGVEQKDFNAMLVAGTPFELERRLAPWNFKTKLLMRTGAFV